MNYYSEKDIRDIVAGVVAQCAANPAAPQKEQPILLEVSARHVHLTTQAVEALFGKGYTLTKKRDLSQPGEFLSEERVKIVTPKGEIANVAVLGPERKAVQAEISLTDARVLGLNVPVNLSGHLEGAADALLIGPAGFYEAKGSVIVARTHIHLTPEAAREFGVHDGQKVRVKVVSDRHLTFDQVPVRVNASFAPAMHIDFDEANACACGKDTKAYILG
ncbi:MAG: phosphate propanoyltransferase [Angelakisella sp.]|nr:phosphate propanoyltransferase [Angelakisella sp.]